MAWTHPAPHKLALSCCVLILGLSVACGTPYVVVRSAEPNPFTGIRAYAVQPLELLDLQVDSKPESEFLAAKGDELDKWATIKTNIRTNFDAALSTEMLRAGLRVDPDAEFVLRPFTTRIDTGYYRIPAWLAVARVHVQVEIKSKLGEVLDEIYLDLGVHYDLLMSPTVNGRLKDAAKLSGEGTAEYLAERSK